MRLLALAALALPGCAAMVQDDWHAHPSHAPLPAMHLEIPGKDVARACGNPAGVAVYGCAVRVVDARVCIIYTPPNPPAWLMEHERKHCAGWDHGPVHVAQGRVAAASPAWSPGTGAE